MKNVSNPPVALETLADRPNTLLAESAPKAAACTAAAWAASSAKTKPELPAPVNVSATLTGVNAPVLNSSVPAGL